MDLVSRAKNMLISPKSEWPIAAAESTDIKGLYTGYIMVLAAIPPLCGWLGFALLFHRIGIGPGLGLLAALVRYVLALAGVYVLAIIASKLAPTFGGRDDMNQGLKLIAYSATAAWVSGVLLLLPILAMLSLLLSLYSLYLLYLGVTPTMGVPAERAVPYTVAMIVASVIVFALVAYLAGVLIVGGMLAL